MASSSYLDHPRYLNQDSRDSGIQSFKRYMSRVHEPIIDLYQVPSKYTDNRFHYTFVPLLHRHHLKIIIEFLCGLHKQERSLESLEESNIVFHRGQLKFRGLKFVQRLSEKDENRDFRLLHDVIKNLIHTYNTSNYSIPPPLKILLFIINDFRYFEDYHGVRIEDALPNHLGIQSHDTVVEYIRSFHDKSSFMRGPEEEQSYESAAKEMYRRDKNWTKKFNSDTRVGPMHDVFNFQNNGKKTTYAGGLNRHILRFCRHCTAHLREHINEHIDGESHFSSVDVELIIMAFFDLELLSFQRMTYKHDIAHRFIPDYSSSSSAGWREHGYKSTKAPSCSSECCSIM